MPRVAGIYSRPTGIDAVANNTIDSGKYNSNVSDVEADLNLPRPIIAGGTGANNAADALTNLGAVAKVGDTMTGPLIFTMANPVVLLNKTASGQTASIQGRLNTLPRWAIQFGNGVSEGGGNLGSNFSIDRYTDAGAFVDSPLSISRQTGVVTILGQIGPMITIGDLTIQKSNPRVRLLKTASGEFASISGSLGANSRWQIQLGDTAAESSGNAGSNFSIDRFNDAGVAIDSPLTIGRATGNSRFNGQVSYNGDVATTSSAIAGRHKYFFSATSQHCLELVGTDTGVAGAYEVFTNNNTALLGYIIATGAAPGTGVAYNTSSDGRLKEDLRPVGDTFIDAIAVHDFKWKATGERNIGIVAQEVLEVFPHAISKVKTADGDFVFGVDYGKFVPLLLEEVKRLRKRVADLEAVIGTAGTILQRLDVLDKFREKIEAL